MKSRQGTDTPISGAVDTVKTKVIEHPFSFRASTDAELNKLIVAAVNHMGGTGEGAEDAYQQSLRALRGRAEDAVKVVVAEYAALPEDQYLDRWSLVELLSALRHRSALDALGRIVASEIPPERSKDPHSFSTAGEEVMIRTTAVDALGRLRAAGVAEAGRLLLRGVEHSNFSVRRASVQAIMESGSPDEQKALRELLDRRQETRLLEIKRRDVREVPQAIGGRFVVNQDRKNEAPPPELKGRDPI